MSNADKRLKRKVRNSYIVSTVSVALVLFLLGSVGYLLVAAMEVAHDLERGIVLTVELRNDSSPTSASGWASVWRQWSPWAR